MKCILGLTRSQRIGSGTGIFTRALLAHPAWGNSVAEIKAVDPNENMRAFLIGAVKDARVSVASGTFQNTGIQNEWADAIVIAQVRSSCEDFHVIFLSELLL